MEEWQIVLLTGGMSIVSSIVTAFITISCTHRNQVKKLVLEKRTELYFEFYNEVEHLMHDRFKIYDSNYIDVLLKFKPKMKLFSSAETMEAFKMFYELITNHYKKYIKFCSQNDPRNDTDLLVTNIDVDGVEYTECLATDIDISDFKSNVEKFKKENLPDSKIINQCIMTLYTEMRKDLGSDIK